MAPLQQVDIRIGGATVQKPATQMAPPRQLRGGAEPLLLLVLRAGGDVGEDAQHRVADLVRLPRDERIEVRGHTPAGV